MNVKRVLASVVVFAAGALLLAENASAQFGGQVKVSNVIEGGVGGVSTARCGNTIVVGFADTEPSRAFSYDGVASSTNGGLTFTDRGTLPVPPPDPFNGPSILGANSNGLGPNNLGPNNPSVACANPNLFYYASVYAPANNCFNGPGGCTGISVSISTDGGTTWGLPGVASMQGADNFTFFSPSMAVDPTNPSHLYVTYIDADITSNFFHDCSNTSYSTDVVQSLDGGKTWVGLLRVEHACDQFGSNPALTGTLATPNIVVSPQGTVYLTDEFIGQSGNANAIHFLRSTDHGNTFSAPMIVSTDAINNALPQLAVDRTTSAFRGTIYLTWSGMPRGTTTEVLMSDSLNQGATFSFPRSVRGMSQGTQINAVLAVDNDGQVADCYYVTGTDTPTSSSNYFYNCLTSFNHAATWVGYQKLVTSAPPGFDALTSDFLLHNDGFFTAFELTSNGQRHVVGEKADLN
jgi:hypothetical protein